MRPNSPIGWNSWEEAERALKEWERKGDLRPRPLVSDNIPTKLTPLKRNGEP